MYGGGATAAAAAAAAIANAIKASGSIVELAPDDFMKLLQRVKDAPVVPRGCCSRTTPKVAG